MRPLRTLKTRLTPSMAVSLLALFIVLGGTGYAATMIKSQDIEDNTIRSQDIKDNKGVTTVDVKDGTLGVNDLASDARHSLRDDEYGYFYNLGAGAIALEAPVIFDTSGGATAGYTYSGITGGVTIVNAGVYQVDFTISTNEASQFSVFVNGLPKPGSTYGSDTGTLTYAGHVLFGAAAGDIVTLVNHSSAGAVTLNTLAGGTATNVNASLVIRRLAEGP